jgi:hypothetical protein
LFEYSKLYCDIDLSTFVNLTTLGHWACAQWNFKDTSDTDATKPYSTLILPSSINEVTWAAFAGTTFNHLYFPVANPSDIQWKSFWSTDPFTFFKIWSQTTVGTLHLYNDPQFNDNWKKEVLSGGKAWGPFKYIIGPSRQNVFGTIQNDIDTL